VSLFTSNSKYRHTVIPAIVFIACFISLNIAVKFLPDGTFMQSFRDHTGNAERNGKTAEIILFGDSRATGFHPVFFERPALTLATPNTTILYAYFLFREIRQRNATHPKLMVLCLGSNNYNDNGIFAKRDFAVRVLPEFNDLADFATTTGGIPYAVDGAFAKLFPVYGYRMELRSPDELLPIIKKIFRKQPPAPNIEAAPDLTGSAAPVRNALDDRNYLEIYRRSVLNDFKISAFHMEILKKMIAAAQAEKIKVLVVELPMEEMMLRLHENLADQLFQKSLTELLEKYKVPLLDLRYKNRYEFNDLNHLSARGLRDLTRDHINPRIEILLR